MSRSNYNVVRNIRETENLQVRKTILKASGSAARQEKIASAVLAAGDSYLDKIAALDRFKKSTKQKTKLQTHRMDWFQEAGHLAALAKRTEDSISGLLESAILVSPHEAGLFEDVLGDSTSDQRARQHFQRNAFSQIQDVKALLRDQRRRRDGGGAGRRTEPGTEPAAADVAAAVFADIFLKLRNSLNDHWQELLELEKGQAAQVAAARRHLAHLSAEYSAQVAMTSELEQFRTSEDDHLEVKLLQQEWQQKLREFDTQMEVSLKDAWDEWSSICTSQFQCDPASGCGNWSADEHTTFVKIYAQFKNTGMSRQRMTAQLSAELEHRSALEVSQHEDWYIRYKSYHKKRKDIINSHNLSERQALMAKGKEALDQCRAKCAEAEAIEKEIAEREALREILHSTLMEQRRQRDDAERERQEAELSALREMKSAEEQRQAVRLKEMERKKAILNDYKRQQRELEEQKRQEKLEQEARQEALRKQQIESERGSVEHRNALVLEKLAEKKRKEEEFLRQEERVTELLMRLATQVPYYDKIQNIESKLDHVTASVRSHEYQGAEEGARGHLAMNGFTDKAVFKDARFRLGLALRAAGVHQSEAAREKIAALHPRAQAPF